MNKPVSSRRLRSEGGQAAVEFAFTITITLLLVFGLIDFSRAIYAASVIQWAAQQGARVGIVNTADVVEAVESRMVGLDLDEATIAVQQPMANLVQVDITYQFKFVIPMLARITGDSITLSASASMVAH